VCVCVYIRHTRYTYTISVIETVIGSCPECAKMACYCIACCYGNSLYHVTSPTTEAGLSSFVFHNHFLKYTQWKEKIYQREKKVLRHLKCAVCITIFGGED